MDSKDQELLAVLEQMKPGFFFGDRHLEQLKELLQTQEELIRLAGDLGRSLFGDWKVRKSVCSS